jgi:hypothetical protein
MHYRKSLLMIAIPLTLYTGSVAADEAADKMVQDALPLMHHTCRTVVDQADGDEAFIVDVVKKMAALVLVNRRIDLTQYAETDEQKAKIREDFIEALRVGCENDKDALLGGVVDASVKSSLDL